MPDDLSEAIKKNASGPQRVKGDSGEVEQFDLADQIAADKYLASKRAARAKGMGIRVGKMVPPGGA